MFSRVQRRLRDEFGFIRGNVLVLVASYMISGLASGLHSSFGSLYVRELGASELMLGLLSSLGALVVAFIRIPGAHIADKHGRKRIIVLFTFGAALGYLVHSLAPDWRFIVLGVLMLNFSRIYMPALEAIEADSLPEERRGVGYSVITMAPSLTMVVGPPIAGYLVSSMGCVPGMRVAYFAVFLLVSGIGLLRAFWLRETVVPESELGGYELGRSLTEGFRSMREALKDVSRDLWVVIIISLISSSEAPLFTVYLPLFAYDVAGVTLVEWGLITSLYWLAALLLGLPCGKLV
ncbi:MAG: MFS transporter, partial [Candidatus Bathyarchaeota archaeon]